MIPATVMLATCTARGASSSPSMVAADRSAALPSETVAMLATGLSAKPPPVKKMVPATRGAHCLRSDSCGGDGADDVHVVRLLQVSDIAFQQRVGRGQDGVVHHQAWRAARCVYRAGRGLEGLWVTGIRGDGADDRSRGLKITGQIRQPADVTGQECDAVAALRKSPRDSGSEAGARASDEQVVAVNTRDVRLSGACQGRPPFQVGESRSGTGWLRDDGSASPRRPGPRVLLRPARCPRRPCFLEVAH